MANDIIATADFRLTGKGYRGEPINETVHAELGKSEAFQYGNGTYTALMWKNGNTDVYDTRYEEVSAKTFKEFAKQLLDNNTMDTVKVELIEED